MGKDVNHMLSLRDILGEGDIADNLVKRESRLLSTTPEAVIHQMHHKMKVMLEATDRCTRSPCSSKSGLVNGLAFKMGKAGLLNGCLDVVKWALSVAESNACMGKVVAAPTAGSCGVIPAVARYLINKGATQNEVVKGLFVAGAIGEVIASRASLAGAKHGCQAEIGSASAMAAGMAVYIMGGNAVMVESAASIALSSHLGLVCDPVGGLVEIPCVIRNASAALTALFAAEASLSGYTFPIPFDEVVDAMREIGEAMPSTLKETAEGGLAGTPTGRRIARCLRCNKDC